MTDAIKNLGDAARNALPAMLDEIERLRAERDAAFAKCEQLAAERPISVEMYDFVSAENERLRAVIANALRCVEWNAGVWGEPHKPCVRLSQEAFEAMRDELAKIKGEA